MSRRFFYCLPILVFTVLANADDKAKFPKAVGEGYEKLSKAIRGEDGPSFMKLFHRDYLYEGLNGAGMDRGPWRRLWLENFDARDYVRMSFEAEEILEDGEEQVIARVRRVAVTKEADGSQKLHEAIFEDTWHFENDVWSLMLRAESEVRVEGAVSSRGASESPKLVALAANLAAKKSDSLAEFWRDVKKSGTPLVEKSGEASRLVTFLWRGEGSESRVLVNGGLPSDQEWKPLTKLGESDVWYRTERVPAKARFTYAFFVDNAISVPAFGGKPAEVFSVGGEHADPLNKQSVDELSLLDLDAESASSLAKPPAAGDVGRVERHQIRSEALGERRFVSVYSPPGYDEESEPYAAAFFFDRGDYTSRRVTRGVLDRLIAEGKIPPTVVFMIHSEGSRSQDLEASSKLVRFVGDELVPWARKTFHLSSKREDYVIGGNRLGAALAVACASHYPASFSKVLSESGDFNACLDATSALDRACIVQRLSEIPKQLIEFYLVVGDLEATALVDSNRHIRDVLSAKGYAVSNIRVAANHHSTTWFDALSRGLPALLKK